MLPPGVEAEQQRQAAERLDQAAERERVMFSLMNERARLRQDRERRPHKFR